MVSINIHEPQVKEIIQWTKRNGETYFSIVLKDDKESEVTIFVDSLYEFTAKLLLAEVEKHNSEY